MPAVLRFLVSGLLAAVVVSGLAAIAIHLYTGGDAAESAVDAVLVEMLSDEERRELAEQLGEQPDDGRRKVPEVVAAPVYELPRRNVEGFVQVEFVVEADGTVSDIEVVGATPAGYYEDQARALIASRRYAPSFQSGEAVVSKRTEIVDFSIAPDTTAPAPR